MKEYVIVDGYNIINALSHLKEISKGSLEEARDAIINELVEYHSFTGKEVIIVFDAYQVKGTKVKKEKYKGIEVVFTKEHQTADSYIEEVVEKLTKNKRDIVKVVTSDWAEQQVVLGSGAVRMIPRELKIEMDQIRHKIKNKVEENKNMKKMLISDRLDKNVLEILEKWRKEGG